MTATDGDAARSILVTGASGFVGRYLVAALARDLPGARIHTPGLDIRDGAALRRAFAEFEPSHCVHLAAIAAIGDARAAPDLAWQVNLHGTLGLAAALRAEAPSCRLLFVSSADCYGGAFRDDPRAVDETRRLAPLNAYGATKAAADLALGALAASDGLDVVRLRAFNHTGPGQRDAFVVAAFARQIARIEAGLQPPVMQVGALDPERDFLDVRDVASAYVAALRAAPDVLPAGTVLNVASGVPRRIGEILDALIAIAGIPVEVRTEAGRLRPSDIPRAVGDAARARTLLGWEPRIAWERTLRDVLDDWRARTAGQA